MSRHVPNLALAAMVSLLPGCAPGGLLGLGGSPPPSLECRLQEDWAIGGFLSDEFDQASLPAAARLPLGHSRELFVAPPLFNVAGCDEAVTEARWISTDPSVAGFTPSSSRRRAWLTGHQAGEADVRAEVTLDNGRQFMARLVIFSPGTRVDTVRVVPTPAPPAGRVVIFKGSVELSPEAAGRSAAQARLAFQVPVAGTLDMFVDWRSPANPVNPSLCPGEVPAGLGCSPIIDGTRFRGHKPVVASAAVSAGLHSLWISNGGSGHERVEYEVGLVAR